jgi:methyl-accepting chemotaxis protein
MWFRRRKFIVNAGLQMKITFIFVIIALAGSIAAATAFNYLALKRLETLMWSTHISLKDTGEIIRPLFIYINIFDFLFVSVLLVVASIWMMRKTTGPLFRMSKDITKAADGDLSVTLALRQKDEVQETAGELNSMITSMRDRYRSINEKQLHVSRSIEELKKEMYKPEIVIRICDSALDSIGAFEKELKSFEIDKPV